MSGAEPQFNPRAIGFRVTLVGSTAAAARDLEGAIRRPGEPVFEMRSAERAADGTYPAELIHAIVFDSNGLGRVSPQDALAVRKETALGTCRAYLWVPPGASPPGDCGLLDDFLQKTPRQDTEGIAPEIATFFREAHDLNRRSTVLATRDALCIAAYQALQPLWLVSYCFAAVHIANAVATLLGRGPWPALLKNPYVVPFATFFGAFFVIHCLYTLFRNSLFAARIVKRLGLGFLLPASAFVALGAGTAYSIVALDESPLRIALAVVAAAAIYRFYVYSLRVRAECSSLSAFQSEMTDPGRRDQLLRTVGGMPFVPEAFPSVACGATPIFVSYMHRSEWSKQAALAVHGWAQAEGFQVFLDGSSIPPGGLWRQYLLRALSECGTFVAVLDGHAPATEWVLAESAYAAALRKQIGKPRILLVVQDAAALASLQAGPFGILYADVFQMPPAARYGVEVLIAGPGGPTPDQLRAALGRIRPMCLTG